MNRIQSLALCTLVALGVPLFGQSTPTPPAAQSKEPEPNPATLRQMKCKLFILHHKDPNQLQRVLWALGSGVPGATIGTANQDGLNTLSVRDFPENIVVIEEAIKRLDVANATMKAADIELHVQVLVASKQPVAEGNLPGELQPVIKSLKEALTYKGYTLAASFVQRVAVNGDRTIYGRGQLEENALASGGAKGSPLLFVDWESDRVTSQEPEASGIGHYFFRKFLFLLRERHGSESVELARMGSDLNLKEGERVVVGTTVVKDRGLIVVLSARRVN